MEVDGIYGSGSTVPNISNCYNIGKIKAISGAKGALGGIIGYITDKTNTENLINNYYLDNISKGWGEINDIDGSINKLTELDMKNNTEFITKLNKDTDVWVSDTIGINDGYPILKWMLCEEEDSEWKIQDGKLMLKWQ